MRSLLTICSSIWVLTTAQCSSSWLREFLLICVLSFFCSYLSKLTIKGCIKQHCVETKCMKCMKGADLISQNWAFWTCLNSRWHCLLLSKNTGLSRSVLSAQINSDSSSWSSQVVDERCRLTFMSQKLSSQPWVLCKPGSLQQSHICHPTSCSTYESWHSLWEFQKN